MIRDRSVILARDLHTMSRSNRPIILALAVLCAAGASAQNNFMKSYGGSGTEVCNSLALRADGNVAMVGETVTPAYVFGSSEGYFLNTDLNGTLQNSFAIGSTLTDAFRRIEALPDSGLYAVGYTASYGANFLDFTITRLNKNNGIVWSRRIGGPGEDLSFGSALTHDGGVVVSGYFGITFSNTDIYVTKLSGTGALVWTTRIAAAGYEFGFSIKRTPDNGFIVCGEASAYGANGPHIFVTKLTSAGAVSWRQVYATTQEDHGTCVVPTLDGGYAVGGYTFGYGATSGDAFLMKLTSSGALSWFRRYGDARYQVTRDLVQMPDSSFWMTGHSSIGGFGNPDIFLVHASKTGALLSAKEYGRTTRTERANAMIVAPDGGFLIGGEMYECPTNQFEALLVRTRPGGYCPTCDTTNVVYTSSAHSPTLFSGFTISSAGVMSTISPMIQSVMSGTTLCSGFETLPIELLEFSGEGQLVGNVLRWVTATETNNDRFELERSSDGALWETFTTVPGAGSSQSTLHYEAIDGRPFDLTYYRLRQVDFDGSSSLSDVIALKRSGAVNALFLYPNPGSDQLTIGTDEDSPIDHVDVMAADGRVVLRSASLSASGRMELNTSELAPGLYQVSLYSNGTSRSAKWLKVDH
jgi:Secretion system C-terminal sorting domain